MYFLHTPSLSFAFVNAQRILIYTPQVNYTGFHSLQNNGNKAVTLVKVVTITILKSCSHIDLGGCRGHTLSKKKKQGCSLTKKANRIAS